MIDVKLDLKGIPVPIRYQPIYKIVMLLAILRYGCQKPHNANLLKLHLFMWGLRDEVNFAVLMDIKTKRRTSVVPWVFEPAMNKVITLGVINSLCEREIKNGFLQVRILPEGLRVLERITELDVFTPEINKIKNIGVLPQSTITEVNKNWELI